MSESCLLSRTRQTSAHLANHSKLKSRIRSASVGRSRDHDLRCRYWAFLFDNLDRAVDEIYQNCEKDESIVECKEAILVLDNYSREFQALIQWLNLNLDYESTPPPNRPNSLTWEVRKSIPKQIPLRNSLFNLNSSNNLNNAIKLKNENKNIKIVDKENYESNKSESINSSLKTKQDKECSCDTSIEDKSLHILNDNKNKVLTNEEQNILNVNHSAVNPTNNVYTTSSKPLNPLARSFKSKLHTMATKPISSTDLTPTLTTPVTTMKTTPLSETSPSKPVISMISTQTAVTKKIINNKPNNQTQISEHSLNIRSNMKNLSSISNENKKTEIKQSIPIIKNNFIKETNSSRAKNVKNDFRKTNSVLSSRNYKENIKQSYSIKDKECQVTSKTKKVKDADGWELVRGRQRYKASPPKVIIIEEESLIKTTADGTVIAVTAASQTSDHWQSPQEVFTSWSPSNQSDSELLRTPGRALQMHEKLSSPSRKRSISESIRIREEKFAKAQEAREKFLEKKAQRFKGIVKKVEEMKNKKEEQQLQLKLSMEKKLQRADEKRRQQLRQIVRKAHDEESKVNEILFINSLEAQNKRYDILNKEKDIEVRLSDLQEERQRKLEEKAAKEAAAEERRKALEEERQARINEMQERRKLKDQKIEQQLQEKEKERLEMATQKALDRQSRISAINALHQANVEELQKKIQLKQEESKRRHEENMEQIRQKALELSVKKSSAGSDDAPPCVPFDTMKMCSLCKVIIKSEVFLFGHLRGKKHNDAICEQNNGQIPSNEELEAYNLKHIVEAPKQTESDIKAIQNCDNERLKATRKKCKKLKQRMIAKGHEYESNWKERINSNKLVKNKSYNKLLKLLKNLNGLSEDTQITGSWPSNMVLSLERIVNELEKSFKANASDSLCFYSLNGIATLTKLLSRILNGNKDRPTSLTDRANSRLAIIYEMMCSQHFDISDYTLHSNNIIQLLDIMSHRINLLDMNLTNSTSTSTSIIFDVVIGSLCRLMATIFQSLYCFYSSINVNTDDCLSFNQTIQDVISYIVRIGLIDKLSLFMSNIRGPIDETPQLATFLQNIIIFFASITNILSLRYDKTVSSTLPDDETQFMMTLRMTHVCGVVSLIYGMLLHSGAPVRDDNKPPLAPSHTIELVLEAIQFINHVSLLDLNMIQSLLGSEGLSFQLRHICSYLIWYCSYHKTTQLLHEVILLIGNFVVLNNENQTLIQCGQRPTIVQQLCSLPFEYFSDEKLSRILFPTLITCCFNNKENRVILEQEMSTLMLSTFIESTIVELQLKAVDPDLMGKKTPLVQERWSFAVRFPKNRWNQAKDYFETPLTN